MGIIQRQGIKNSLVNFFGVGIGLIATLFIYPLDLGAKGLMEYVIYLAFLFLPFAQFGLSAVYLKYFPKFKAEINNFQTYLIRKIGIYYLAFFIFFIAVRYALIYIFNLYHFESNDNFQTYSLYVPFLVLLMVCQSFLIAIADSNKRIVVPDIIRNVIQKVYFPMLVLLKYLLGFSGHVLIGLVISYYILSVTLLYIYCKTQGFIHIEFRKKWKVPDNLKMEIKKYNIFSILNEISTQLVYSIDTVMVGSIIGFLATGIYTSMVYISNTLSIPSASLLRVSSPIISEHMAEGHLEKVESIYKKVSITLFISGMIFFTLIGFLINDLLSLTKYSEQLKVGLSVFLFIALARLFDMITSVNTQILVFSKYYRYNLILIVFLGVSNLILNLKLIPIYGITGAALATLISTVAYNILKLLLIYWKMRLQPFSLNTIKVLFLSAMLIAVLYFLSGILFFSNVYIAIVVKGIVCTFIIGVLYILPIYLLGISEDLNNLIKKTLNGLKVQR